MSGSVHHLTSATQAERRHINQFKAASNSMYQLKIISEILPRSDEGTSLDVTDLSIGPTAGPNVQTTAPKQKIKTIL